MKFLFALLIGFLFPPNLANAADPDWAEKGNGGDLLVCQNGQTYFLDYFESIFYYQLTPELPKVTYNVTNDTVGITQLSKYLILVINRLRTIDPERYSLYFDYIEDLKNQVQFVNTPIYPIDDEGNLRHIRSKCDLRQLIVQTHSHFSHPPRLLIHKRLWSALSGQQKIVALLHEVILREVRQQRPMIKSTAKIRRYNAFLISREFKEVKRIQYSMLVKDLFKN